MKQNKWELIKDRKRKEKWESECVSIVCQGKKEKKRRSMGEVLKYDG